MGVFLALGRPEYASCRPLFGLPSVVGLPKNYYSYSPCVLDHEHGPDVAHEALNLLPLNESLGSGLPTGERGKGFTPITTCLGTKA